jgi:hypothetical protein
LAGGIHALAGLNGSFPSQVLVMARFLLLDFLFRVCECLEAGAPAMPAPPGGELFDGFDDFGQLSRGQRAGTGSLAVDDDHVHRPAGALFPVERA